MDAAVVDGVDAAGRDLLRLHRRCCWSAMTVWELRSPTVARKGLLPLVTTRGDRLFIGLLAAAYVNLAWTGLTDLPQWWGAGLSAARARLRSCDGDRAADANRLTHSDLHRGITMRTASICAARCTRAAAAPRVADEAAARRWIDQEFQPSTLSKEQQLAELKWFIDAAAQLKAQGIDEISVVSETITTHEYEAKTLAQARSRRSPASRSSTT